MPVKLSRPVARIVSARATVRGLDGEALVVTMTSEGVYVRERGRRTQYGPVPYGRLYLEAARITAARRDAEKRAARKSRRNAR